MSASRAAWRASASFADLCELGARFVDGKLAFFPGWNAPDLDHESDEIADVLARSCRAGFLTVASQPARAEQRAFVAGFARAEIASALQRERPEGLVVVVHASGVASRPFESEPVSLHGGVAHAFVGHDARADEIVCFEDHVSQSALEELRKQAWVSVHDREWGRRDTLWNHLERVLDDVGR